MTAQAAPDPPAVRVRELTVAFPAGGGEVPAVCGISVDLRAGQITGLVGESGSGKSTLALALLNAVPEPGRVTSGTVDIDGIGDVLSLPPAGLRGARGAKIGFVFQASQNSLNPLKPTGKQLLDLGRSHGVRDLRALVGRARDLLERMGLDAVRVLSSYQHELSGGMRQRVGIAFALVLNARLLVLDEPTTALDLLSQAAVLDIVRNAHEELGLTTLVVSHDLGVIGELADRTAVMYAGRIVEEAPTAALLREPWHPYTRGLLGALPRITGDPDRASPLPGRPPDLAELPRDGCAFKDRCPLSMPVCAEVEPPDRTDGDHRIACHAVSPGHGRRSAPGRPGVTR